MDSDDTTELEEFTPTELEAVHEVELCVEHFHRAHGQLVAFHHSTGRAFDHLDKAENLLRECGRPELADIIRDEYLPRGILDSYDTQAPSGRWSYDLLESFQDDFLEEFVALGQTVRETVTEGIRHPVERKQERDWNRRARRD